MNTESGELYLELNCMANFMLLLTFKFFATPCFSRCKRLRVQTLTVTMSAVKDSLYTCHGKPLFVARTRLPLPQAACSLIHHKPLSQGWLHYTQKP